MAHETPIKVETIFSLLGSLSVLSIFVVMPYTIAYFSFFNVAFMSFFSLTEYITFAAGPLLTVATVVTLYFLIPYIPRVFSDKTEKFPGWFLRYQDRHKGLFRPGLTVADVTFALPFLLLLPVGAVILLVFATTDLILTALPFFGLMFVVMVWRLFTVAPAVLYVAAFLIFELMMFGYGRANAIDAYAAKKRVELAGKDASVEGYLAFAGSSAVLLFDDQDKLFVVKLDGSGRISFGKLDRPSARRCIDVGPFRAIRGLFGHAGCAS
jgi:hypothetical protein